jgi:probable rRNA maturation factor
VSVRRRIVEVVVSAPRAARLRAPARRFCALALAAAGFAEWDIAVLLCDDARIADLNGRYRGARRPTDVLSFPRTQSPSARLVEGDIAVSLETVGRNAAALGLEEGEELERLLVHGILHLSGMDHGRGRRRKMLATQEALLGRLRTQRNSRESDR